MSQAQAAAQQVHTSMVDRCACAYSALANPAFSAPNTHCSMSSTRYRRPNASSAPGVRISTSHSVPPLSTGSTASAGRAHHDHDTLSRECTEHRAVQGSRLSGRSGVANGKQSAASLSPQGTPLHSLSTKQAPAFLASRACRHLQPHAAYRCRKRRCQCTAKTAGGWGCRRRGQRCLCRPAWLREGVHDTNKMMTIRG